MIRLIPIAVVAMTILALLPAAGPPIGRADEPLPEPPLPLSVIGVSPQTTLNARDYLNLAEARVGIVRVPLNWARVQAEPGDCEPAPVHGVCNWADADADIGNAAESGARILPILSDVPRFVSKYATEPPLDPQAREGWRDFLMAAAQRYGPGGAFWENEFLEYPFEGEAQPIAEWQVWNEPNGKTFFHPSPDPRRYAKLVSLTERALHSVDPEAEIVLAGMFGAAKLPQARFLRRFYRVEGIERSFDGIALHPYAPNLRDLKLQLRRVRREARRANDDEVGIWITELGWSSGSGGHRLEKGPAGQAKMLTKSFDLLAKRRQAWNIRGVIWFTWQDRRDAEACEFCRHAGLFDAVERPKPAWTAFKRATGAEP